jgi:hypothetical protein
MTAPAWPRHGETVNWDDALKAYIDYFAGSGGGGGGTGADGRGIVSVVKTAGTGAPGTTDTYTITYTDATTSTFFVYNGADGTNGTNGTNGTDGTDATVTPAAVAATLSDSAVKTPLDAEIVSASGPVADLAVGKSKARVRPVVRNRSKLAKFATALAQKNAPVITIVGNSIAHGVGSDGSTATTAGAYDPYRQYAWPVLLRKALCREARLLPGDDFVHPGTYYSVTTTSGTATRSSSVASFGSLTGGGLVLNASTASADFPANKMSKFTQVDVYYFGSASGIAGYSPRVLIDDVERSAGGVVSAANIAVTSITGLTDASHKITVQGTGSANGCSVLGVVVRRAATGMVVNRVAVPGAKATDVLGDVGFTTQQKNRNIDAAVLAGFSDLVILSMTANEVYAQQPLATYQDAVQQIITRATSAGACVLLVGDPAVNGEETDYAIKGSDYRGVLKTLSDTTADVAYADFNDVFGDRSVAAALGLFDPGGSVHPMLEGHRRMADFIAREVLPGASVAYDLTNPPSTSNATVIKDRIWTPASGSTSIDEFNDDTLDPAWVRVDKSGGSARATWTEGADVLSAYNDGGDAGVEMHGLVRPLADIGGAMANGDAFITCMTIHGNQSGGVNSNSMGGLVLADGIVSGSGLQLWAMTWLNPTVGQLANSLYSQSGWQTNTSGPASYICNPGRIYQRLVKTGTNAWRLDLSPDGVSWVKGVVTSAMAITPTYIGFSSSSWGGSYKSVVAYEFIRRVAGIS